MANVQKHTTKAAQAIFRHCNREHKNPGNPDIDTTRTHLNYRLSPERGMSDSDYFKQRREALVIYNNRKDIKTLAAWIVTAPKNLPQAKLKHFFEVSYEFLSDFFGQYEISEGGDIISSAAVISDRNVISAVVHFDETTPHMHFNFVPENTDGRICARDVLSKEQLKKFHAGFKEKLAEHGFSGYYSGITKRQGGNRTIKQLKQQRDRQPRREHEKGGRR